MRRALLVAIVAVAIVDIAALTGWRLDHASDDVRFLTLDERELRVVPPDDTSSAVVLRVAVHGDTMPGSSQDEFQPAWIGQDQLSRLGFDCSMWLADPRARDHYRRQLARPAFVAFDVGTDVWRARLDDWSIRAGAQAAPDATQAAGPADARTASAAIGAITTRSSRLVPIEIAADKGALRAKYRARPATLILPVVVGIRFVESTPSHARTEVQGRINELHPRTIVVPARFTAVFAGLSGVSRVSEDGRAPDELPHAPRYDVTLAVGPALRPWVVDARRLGSRNSTP